MNSETLQDRLILILDIMFQDFKGRSIGDNQAISSCGSMRSIAKRLSQPYEIWKAAFEDFFKYKRGYPMFKRKSHLQQSFQCPQQVIVDFEQEYLNLPKKKGIKTTQSDEPICWDTAFASRVPLKRELPAQLLERKVRWVAKSPLLALLV
ncbi:hypothetical protein EBR43_02375 [bacterium]|nr:hypothetical protein [bacterium]